MFKIIGSVSLIAVLAVACSQGNSSSSNADGSVGGASPSGGTSSAGGSKASSNSAVGKGGATGSTSSSSKVTANGGATSSSETSDEGGAAASDTTSAGGTKADGGKSSSGKSSTGGKAQGGGGGKGGAGGKTTANNAGSGNTGDGGSSGAGKTGGASNAGGATSNGGTPSSGGSGACVKPEMPAAPASGTNDVVNGGKLITFNDDGGWCWYQDERVIVDPEANKMVIGSVAISGSRNGQIDVTMYDLAGGTSQRSTLGKLNPDDHNAPGLLRVSKDKYVAVYTTHNDDCYSYYNVYENGKWGSQNKFDWTSYGCPTPNSKTVSYSNLWHMGDKIYNFVRSVETSPNLITSTDGSKWEFAGRLSSTPRVGYVAGYYKYWGNNTDRIDFLATEAHPRDEDNSLYHGYVKDGKSYDSTGKQVGEVSVATKGSAPDITKFTKVYATGTTINGAKLIHMWNHDITRYADGTIVATGQGRADTTTDDPDKRFIYMRFDGTQWKSTYLVRGGKKLYADEQDYTGLSAVHPNDPNTIYISTTYDPRDDKTQFTKHEIWRGTTCDKGATFSWTPITQNSTKDNLRPVVPYWEGGKTALLWEVGDYLTAQTYKTKIVGIIMDGS